MKKLLNFFSVAVIIVSFCISYLNMKEQDHSQWFNYAKNNTTMEIVLNDTSMSNEDIYEQFLALSQHYNLNIIKENYFYDEHNQLTMNYSVILNHELANQKTLKSGEYINPSNTLDDVYISTIKSNDNQQVGWLDDFLADDQVNIMTLKHYLNKDYSMEGTYQIQLVNLNDKDEIINAISMSFNIPIADLSSNYSLRDSGNLYVKILKTLEVVMFVSLAITIVFYVSKLFTKIGIYKLNGYTNFDIWLKLILPTILLQFCVLIIISIGSWIVLKNIDFMFIATIIKQMSIAILMTLICSYLLFYFVKQYSISKLIKGENLSKLLIRINRFIRIASLTLITILFSFVMCKMDQYKNMEKALSYWNKYSDYAMLNYYQSTNTGAEMTQVDNETLEREEYEYYKYLESIDAFSVSTEERNISRSIYFPDIPKPDYLPNNYNFYEMKVNTTYFDTLGIKDTEGQDIKVDIKDPIRYTLIPKSKEKDLETIQFTLNMEENNKRRLSDQQLIETKYLIYDDTKNNKFFSFNVHINANDGNMLTTPVITVFNSYSGSTSDIQVQATGINSRIKIPMQGKTIKEFNEIIQPMATQIMPEKMKVYGNVVYFTVEGIFDEQNAIIAQGIRQGIVLFVLVIILYVIISFQSNELYLNANSKRLAVLKLSGYSFKDRYQKYLSKIRTDEIILTIVYIVMIMYQSYYFKDMMMVSYKASKVLYVLFIPLVLIDYVMTKLVIRKKEIKNLNKVLKGE